MISLKSIGLVVLMSLVAVTWAVDIDEHELEVAEFKEVKVYHEDQKIGNRFFKKKDRCSCNSQTSCGCCAKPSMLGYTLQGCLNFTLFAADKNLEVLLQVQEKNLAQYNFSIAPLDQMCSSMPGKLNFLKFCLHTNTTETEEHGLKSCTSLDIKFKGITFAIINFSCIRLKDGKLDFDFHQEIDRQTMLKVKIKNPISGIKNLINKLLEKRNEIS